MTHELRARQQTSLTPRLQQSVKLLQMSTLDFNREIAAAIESNPFLENQEESRATEERLDAEDVVAQDGMMAATAEAATACAADAGGSNTAIPQTQHIEPDKADPPATYSGDYPAGENPGRPDPDVGQWAHDEISLRSLLRTDLSSYRLNERSRYLVEYIIDALDADGYLRVPFAELADPGQFSPPPVGTEWETALSLVQQLSIPGLAARDLGECLTLQLDALPLDASRKELALRIVAQALEKVGRSDYTGLARTMDCSESQARQACELIRTLDPRPAGRFAPLAPDSYVIPDAMVRKTGKSWVAIPNDNARPHASLNQTYAKWFREAQCADRSLMAQALQEARWLMRSLEQRGNTIQRVAQAIVARQQTFFDYGAIALRPLMLSEIADELGLHESTVSRATSNKYLACPRGIYEFKHFFSRELATRSGGTCSAMAVRALIQEMIAAEDPKEPLSDVVLARKLAREGIVVARRTVSKYRAQINRPAAELRRAKRAL